MCCFGLYYIVEMATLRRAAKTDLLRSHPLIYFNTGFYTFFAKLYLCVLNHYWWREWWSLYTRATALPTSTEFLTYTLSFCLLFVSSMSGHISGKRRARLKSISAFATTSSECDDLPLSCSSGTSVWPLMNSVHQKRSCWTLLQFYP